MQNYAIVVSKFNENVTDKLLAGAMEEFKKNNISNIKVITVPGAVEIPLATQLLAQQKKYHAIVCLGAVIRGETSHYDYVCAQVSNGCQKVMLKYNLPVIFGILTTENEEQALARVSETEHKGREAVQAALIMTSIIANEIN